LFRPRPLRARPLLLAGLVVGLVACSKDSSPGRDATTADALHDARPADAHPAEARDAGLPKVTFPRDEAPHSGQVEWWYYTGQLEAAGPKTYGFELVTFQYVLNDRPVYIGHFAVTDLAKQSYSLKVESSTTDQRGAQSGFDLTVGSLLKMKGHEGKDQLSATMPGYGLELALSAKKPVVLQYDKGWMTVGSDLPFYYYSYTRMDVTGSLTVDGTKQEVTGEAWMDHQWGEMGYFGADFSGWDWYALRLDDATEVMLFVVKRPAPKQGFVGGTLIDTAGKPTPVAAFTVTPTGEWTSPHTQGVYPQGWTIEIPGDELSVTVTPRLADQEFYERYFTTPIYWEGLCTVSGTRKGKAVKGSAYVELTGYAK